MKLINPWPAGYKINTRSPFGWRNDPFTGKRTFHKGVDVGGSFPVTAAANGKVVHNSRDWATLSKSEKARQSGGNVVIIEHAPNFFTVYYHGAHRSKLNIGDTVRAGDFIFTSGSTGRSTANHLHFEVRKTRGGNQIDPVPYLQGASATEKALISVDGRLNRNTWKAFQQALKDAGHFEGTAAANTNPDGIPNVITYRAVQKWSGAKVDGSFGPETRKAVQRKLGVKDDGIWGRQTIMALQRAINEGRI